MDAVGHEQGTRPEEAGVPGGPVVPVAQPAAKDDVGPGHEHDVVRRLGVGQATEAGSERRRHHLVGVEDEDPVPGRLRDREAAGWIGDAAGALVLEDGGAHPLGDGGRLVVAVLVDDDDFVAPRQERAERVVELGRLVERDDDAADPGHA